MTKCLIQLHDTEVIEDVYGEIPKEPIIVEMQDYSSADYMWHYKKGNIWVYYHDGFSNTPESERTYNFTILMVK